MKIRDREWGANETKVPNDGYALEHDKNMLWTRVELSFNAECNHSPK